MDRIDELVAQVAGWLGIPWMPAQTALLRSYASWLGSEGVELGGIGPAEADRLWSRHVLDSLTFGHSLRRGAQVLDVGSGVGLPGIPLAIAFPSASVSLVERAGRRVDGLRRAIAILGLRVNVVHADIDRFSGAFDRVVSRATFPPEEAIPRLVPLAGPGGDIVLGLGASPTISQIQAWLTLPVPEGWGSEVLRVPPEVLDSTPALLRIAPT